MKSFFKRTLVFLMAIVMIMGCMPLQVFAAQSDVISDSFDADLRNLPTLPILYLKEYNADNGSSKVASVTTVNENGSFMFEVDNASEDKYYSVYVGNSDQFRLVFSDEDALHPNEIGFTSVDNDNEYVVFLTQDANGNYSFDFTKAQEQPKIEPILGSFEITKIELDSNNVPVMGAEFSIYLVTKDAEPIFVDKKQTNEDGKILFDNILCGEYFCEETKAPDGYFEDGFATSVRVKENDTTRIQFTNEPKCSVTIKKVDSITGDAIQGITFGIYTKDSFLMDYKVTNVDGIITFDNLHYGEFYIQEIDTGEDQYEYSDKIFNIKLSQQNKHLSYVQNQELLIPNDPLYSIYVTKQDTETGEPVSDALLALKDANGNIVSEWVTVNGTNTISGLKAGTYTIEEIEPADGYFKSDAKIPVVIEPNGNFNYVFENTPIYNITVQKLDEYGIGVAGAKLALKDANKTIYTWTSTGNPDAMPELAPGVYTISEIEPPEGYTKGEDKVITVGREYEKHIQYYNTSIRYTVTIDKFDTETGNALAGAEFELRDSSNNLIDAWTSTTSTKVISNLQQGIYTLTEIKAPNGYKINQKTTEVIVGSGGTFHYNIGNTPLYNITVQKVDDEGNGVQGATMVLKDLSGNPIYTWISTGNQDAIPELVPGQYIISETNTPAGYHTGEDKIITVGKDEDLNIKFVNDIIRYSIVVKKFDNETMNLIAGAQLVLKDANGNVIHNWTSKTTPETIPNLKPGDYTIEEIAAPDGYEKTNTEVTVTVSANGIFEYGVGNTPLYDVTIQKKDDEGNGLAGAKFELRNEDGVLVHTWTSTGNPDAMPKLRPGTYTIKEVETPNGYTGIETQTFTVSKTSEKNIVVTNTLIRYSIEVKKLDSETGNLLAGAKLVLKNASGETVYEWTSTDKVEVIPNLKPGAYTIEETQAPNGYRLNGSTLTFNVGEGLDNEFEFYNAPIYNFTVIKLDDEGNALAGAEFEMRDARGNLIKVWTSGTAPTVIDDLDFGTYTITETKVPDGYTASTTTWNVDIGVNGQKELTVVNTLIRYGITVEKLDDEGNRLAGAKFELKDANGKLIHSWTSASDKVESIPNLKPGAYTITEIETPDGYTADNEVTNITVGAGFESNIVIKNTLIRYDITVEKYDTETDKALAGAQLALKDAGGKVVYEWTSTDKAETIPNLKPGTYTLYEISAPNGYERNTDEMTIVVGAGKDANHRFGNTPIYNIVIEKFDDENNPLAGAEFELKDSSGKVIATWTSTTVGKTITGLTPGDYVLTETKIPNGYTAEKTTYEFSVNKTSEKTIKVVNTLIRYGITVEKLDDEGNRLAGAKFELKDANGKLIHSWTSASDKVESIPNLKPGAYTITEIETPDGYTADNEVTNITVGAGFESNIVIKNTLIRYDITVEKYDTETDKALAGAQLALKDAGGKVVYEWTSTDKAETIPNLKPGTYTLYEISAPNGYEKNETVMTITVGAGQESAYRFGNTPLYDIVIEKFDTKTDKLLAGAELILKDKDGNVIHNWITTDKSEEIKGLKPGVYTLTEVNAPEGYDKNETEMTIEVKRDGETTFRFGNTPTAIEELPEAPQTGDNSNIGFYFFTMISSLLCLVILLFVRKRNNLN